jgi:hypothetical protein
MSMQRFAAPRAAAGRQARFQHPFDACLGAK